MDPDNAMIASFIFFSDILIQNIQQKEDTIIFRQNYITRLHRKRCFTLYIVSLFCHIFVSQKCYIFIEQVERLGVGLLSQLGSDNEVNTPQN